MLRKLAKNTIPGELTTRPPEQNKTDQLVTLVFKGRNA